MEKWPIARNRAHAGAVWQVSFTPGERGLREKNSTKQTIIYKTFQKKKTVASVGDDGNCLIWKLNDNESANVHQVIEFHV